MTIIDIWWKDYKGFNSWRKENDIIDLVKSFNDSLPDFKIWKSTHGITDQHLIDVKNIGQFFRDSDIKVVYENKQIEGTDPIPEKYGIIYPINLREIKKHLKKNSQKYLEFTPYLKWAKVRRSWNKMIDLDSSDIIDSFTYSLGNAPDSPEHCQWYFSTGHNVLKLGGVTLPKFVDINYKNLDFVNLDHLTITGDYHGGTDLDICFSHVDNVIIKDAVWRSVTFYNCTIFNLNIINSEISNFVFVDCIISGFYTKDSNLHSINFEGGSINKISTINTSLNGIKYIAPVQNWFEGKLSTVSATVNTMDELKLAFQSNGHLEDAKNIFLRAKHQKMKLAFFESINFYGFGDDIMNFSVSRIWYRIKSNIKSFVSGISLLFPFVFWDFGRKPILLFLHWFLVIFIFSIVYYYASWSDTQNNYYDSFFTSINCIFRLGINLDDFTSNQMKIAIGLESMISLFFIPLIVAGILNKSKY